MLCFSNGVNADTAKVKKPSFGHYPVQRVHYRIAYNRKTEFKTYERMSERICTRPYNNFHVWIVYILELYFHCLTIITEASAN